MTKHPSRSVAFKRHVAQECFAPIVNYAAGKPLRLAG